MIRTQTKNKPLTASRCLILTLPTILLTTPAITSATDQTYLQITNVSGAPLNLTSDNILAMPKTIANANLLCYGLLIALGDWGGVKLSYLLNQAGLDTSVESINFARQTGTR
jgi:DMSO/TMAO reductase YedYZ molybdopterin-dependent catalytic subunit